MFYWSAAFKKILGCLPERPGQCRRKFFFKRSAAFKKNCVGPKLADRLAGWHGTWVAWHRLWALLWALLGAVGALWVVGWWDVVGNL